MNFQDRNWEVSSQGVGNTAFSDDVLYLTYDTSELLTCTIRPTILPNYSYLHS